MISQRKVEKKYKEMLELVKNDKHFDIDLTNRVNCYVCDCGHITKTKDVDKGVTPFYHECEKCSDLSKSTFYQDIAPNKQATQEWYRPTLKEVLKKRKDPVFLQHILQGGLDSRKIQKTDDL